MKNGETVQALKDVLADSYALYLKTQNYHWNVTGMQFGALHTLFETQYTDLATAIDEIAERIRALGHKAPGGFKAYQNASKIKDGDENADAKTMLKDLTKDQDHIGKTLASALEKAQKEEDEVSADLLIGRLTQHQKNHWMLQAFLG